jgi:tripartite-type tricarboxylate transporter receptor subunit TctC
MTPRASMSGRQVAGLMATLVIAMVLAIAGIAPSPAAGADFFAGKTINFIVGTDVTGGFSIYGRLIARYLGRYIPGNPTLVFKNMPGAGSNTAAVYLYRIAPKDGTAIGNVLPNAILGQLFDERVANKFDPRDFQYLAAAEHGTRLCMTMRGSKFKTYEDVLSQKAVIGATAAGGPTYDYASWHKATGAMFDIVPGYKGPGDLYLAMERGEIDGVCGLDWSALKSQKPDWLRDKKLNFLVQDGLDPDPELAALGIPQPWPYIKNETDRKAIELIIGFQQAFGKAYLAPPDVPAAQIKQLRDAFAAALHDPALLAEAEKLQIDIAPQTGDEVQQLVEKLYSTPASVVERVKQLMRQ